MGGGGAGELVYIRCPQGEGNMNIAFSNTHNLVLIYRTTYRLHMRKPQPPGAEPRMCRKTRAAQKMSTVYVTVSGCWLPAPLLLRTLRPRLRRWKNNKTLIPEGEGDK